MDINIGDQFDRQVVDNFSVCLQHESWTRQQLLAYQAQALSACREYAYTHSRFYQSFHKGLMDRPLQELPVLTKVMMMEQFDDLVTDRSIRLHDVRQYLTRIEDTKLFLDQYYITATSGSTGQPGIFLSNPIEDSIEGNAFIRSEYWSGITPDSRVAVVTATATAMSKG